MAITITDPNTISSNRSHSLGDGMMQEMFTWSAVSGATSGTITATNMIRLKHVLVLGGRLNHTAAPTYSGNVATLAFTVPAETAATLVSDGITYTAVANKGAGGNNITIRLIDGTGDTPAVTNGTETVSVSGNAIVVHIDPTVVIGSTRTNVRIAVNASAAAAALVTATGTSATVASVSTATPLASGVTGGGSGTVLCLGI